MVIKQAFQYKTQGIYLKMWPKERDSFISKLNEYVEFRFTSITNTYTFIKQMRSL